MLVQTMDLVMNSELVVFQLQEATAQLTELKKSINCGELGVGDVNKGD